MSRNQNSHFARIPKADIKRSRFDISNSVKTTFNAGKLVPIEWWEVLPGDTFSVDASILTRMQTLITPLMDDMYLDLYFFYAPNRLLWQNWQHFCGENDRPWFDEEVEYSVPQISFSMSEADISNGITVKKGTVADYLGLPLPIPGTTEDDGSRSVRVSHLPFRMYCRVWNEWFKSESLQNNAAFTDYDTGTSLNSDGEALYGGALLPVNKYRDYFTSALPSPQRGPEVTIGVGDIAPVFAGSSNINFDEIKSLAGGSLSPLRFYTSSPESGAQSGWHDLKVYNGSSGIEAAGAIAGESAAASSGTHYYFTPANMYADISNATGISINELRLAFATQRYYETIARSGSRYIELLDSVFGVQAPDQRLQRTEYLGGQRVHVNVNQVIQNSETNNTPLGDLGAYSLTTDNQNCFTKSFVEHGILMCMAAVRYDHSYQDGIDRQFMREDFFDYYNPIMANLGEQPIYNKQIFAGSLRDDEVFGYNEAWAEYRYKNNRISGEFRSRYDQTLDYWHLADNYTSLPYLSEDWIKENGETVDRAIAVSQRVSDQFMLDIYFKVDATRPMPLYSIPGLNVL